MKLLNPITEDKVISEFLRGELDSPRFGKKIRDALARKNQLATILTEPNLRSKEGNRFRRDLLGEVRGFGKNKDLFENFPAEVRWFRAIIEKDELKRVKYINYSYWNELSGGTRLPAKAAKNILAGTKTFDVSNEGFFGILAEIKNGTKLPPLILVARNKRSRVVVLEGHARLTAYFLEPKLIPEQIEVIIGYSGRLGSWDLY